MCRSLLYNQYTFSNLVSFVGNKAAAATAAIWSWTGFLKSSKNFKKKDSLVKG